MNQDTFLSDLKKLLNKHNLWFSGTVKIREIGVWDAKTANVEICDVANYGYARDTSGPMMNFNINQVAIESSFSPKIVRTVIMDKDKLLANGVVSPLTQESFHNRADYKDHLKRHGCVEIGNDFNNAKMRTEIHGDFDCRKELSQATHQVMEKYGN